MELLENNETRATPMILQQTEGTWLMYYGAE